MMEESPGPIDLVRTGNDCLTVFDKGLVAFQPICPGTLEAYGWNGDTGSDEAFILAKQGDIVIESIGPEEAVIYDATRSLPGVKLPELVPYRPGPNRSPIDLLLPARLMNSIFILFTILPGTSTVVVPFREIEIRGYRARYEQHSLQKCL